MQNIEIQRKGFMFVLSSPSGAGKTTIARALLADEKNLAPSISITTREKRPNEIHGKDYYFVSEDEFKALVSQNAFLEYANVFGSYYGTPKLEVENTLATGQDILFDIDWQGTAKLAEFNKENLVSIFILPPSIAELENRLRNRNTDSEETILKRMSKAYIEITHYDSYDYVIVNNDIAESVKKVSAILNAERLKKYRQIGLDKFVENLLEGN
ncbi:MAG: guanylate kinase [Alphaproteobacteria bacterium]